MFDGNNSDAAVKYGMLFLICGLIGAYLSSCFLQGVMASCCDWCSAVDSKRHHTRKLSCLPVQYNRMVIKTINGDRKKCSKICWLALTSGMYESKSTANYVTARHSTAQHSTVRHSTAGLDRAQYRTAPHSAALRP